MRSFSILSNSSYIITTREFGPTVEYGIGVYALERNKVIVGDPAARAVSFFLDGNDPTILPLVGDGLLPPDIDGKQKPKNDVPRDHAKAARSANTRSWGAGRVAPQTHIDRTSRLNYYCLTYRRT